MPVALIGGFVVDIFTLNHIDQIFDNAILIFHLIVVGLAITLLYSRDTPFGTKFLNRKKIAWLQTAMVFSFGALFSGFIIFYTRSGSLLTSWPFLLSMLILMLSTEFRKRYFEKLTLQIVIYYLAILSWVVFFVPVVIKKMGPLIFLLSTVLSLVLIGLFLALLRRINRERLYVNGRKLITQIVAIMIVFNGLYFLNIIPPIPLSLKYKSVYYDVERLYPGYRVQYESTAWYNFWRKRSQTMYWRSGEDLFVFTQVFAPTNLKTQVQHKWDWYNESERRWEERSTITLRIEGGRSDGYRGFSKKTNLQYGKWRVKTQTLTGQTLGVIDFDVEPYGPKIRELKFEEL